MRSFSDNDIYLMDFPSETLANLKVFQCLKNPVFVENYEYLWVMADVIRPSEYLFDVIAGALSQFK